MNGCQRIPNLYLLVMNYFEDYLSSRLLFVVQCHKKHYI